MPCSPQRFPTASRSWSATWATATCTTSPCISFDDWARRSDPDREVDALQTKVHDIAASLGGSFSAEHGIGRKLVGELTRLTSPLELELLRNVKMAFDPQSRLNPGAMFRQILD